MAFPVINPILQFFDNSGNVLSSGKLFVYEPGTTTKKTTYTDENLSVPNANPIILDSAGRCVIFLTDGAEYKFVLAPSTDTDPPAAPIKTIDEVKSPTALTQATIGAAFYPRTAAEIAAGVTPTNYAYEPGNVKRYGAVGDGVANDRTAIVNAIAVAVALGGGQVFFPEGTYLITSAITISANQPVQLVGAGRQASIIDPAGNFDVFTFSGGAVGSGVESLGVDATDMTGGRVFVVNTQDRVYFEDLWINSPYNVWHIQRCNVCSISESWIYGVRGAYGVNWYGDDSNRSDVLDIDNVQFSCTSNTVGTDCIIMDGNVNTLDIRHVACTSMGRGLLVKKTTGTNSPQFVTAYDFQVDFPLHEAVRLLDSARSIYLTDLYTHGSVDADGVYIDSSVHDVSIQNGKIDDHYKCGVNALGRYIRIANAQISNNSKAGSASYPGIAIGAASIGVNIIGGLSGQWLGYAANLQSYGVDIAAGAQAYVVAGTNLRNNVTADYRDLANDSTSFIGGFVGASTSVHRFPGDVQVSRAIITGGVPTVAASQLGIGTTTSATVGAAGAATALPAQPLGYLVMNLAGTNIKVPYYTA